MNVKGFKNHLDTQEVIIKNLKKIKRLSSENNKNSFTPSFIEDTASGIRTSPVNIKSFSLMFWGEGGTLNNVSVPNGFSIEFNNSNGEFSNSINYTVPTSVIDGYQRVTITSII